MSQLIQAIYEQGVFRPLQPVQLAEHSQVSLVVASATDAPETYSAERKAEFLLSNAVDAEDYKAACDEVRKLGLDPANVPHHRPAGE